MTMLTEGNTFRCFFQSNVQHLEREVGRLEGAVKEKTRENKRLQDNFNTVKTANDAMRKEVRRYL